MAEIKSKKEEFREKSINELLSSEESYLHHLHLLKEYFVNPILIQQWLPQHLFNCIFGNIVPVEAVNNRLFEELRRNIATDTIGQPFLKLTPYLKIYATYAKNYEEGQSSLKEYEDRNKHFKKFIENQECRPELNGLKLNSLLITPIQRIPRYKLLLHEIITHTPSDHHDYTRLVDAAKAIEDVAEHINMHVSQTSDFQVLLKVQKALTHSQPRIIAPGRILIKHGTVKKLSRRGNGEHERVLFLFTDIIMYCKPKYSSYLKPESIECCCILPLNHCSVTPIFEVTFKVCCKDEEIKFYVDSPFECNLWIETIQSAIRKNSSSKATLRKGVSSKILLTRKMLGKHKADNLSVIMKKQINKRADKYDIENVSLSENLEYEVPKKRTKHLLAIMTDKNENILKDEAKANLLLPENGIYECSQECSLQNDVLDTSDDAIFIKTPEKFHISDGDCRISSFNKHPTHKNAYFGKRSDVFSCIIL